MSGPILMTAIATILALIPLAAGFNQGSIIAAELGTVVIGGLFSSTFLTLLVVPAVYSLVDGVKRRVARARGAAPTPAPEAAATAWAVRAEAARRHGPGPPGRAARILRRCSIKRHALTGSTASRALRLAAARRGRDAGDRRPDR